MSNFIPMVSESPPPLDEKTFDWGEDEEDFGTFTGADDSASEINISNNEYDSDYINDNVSTNKKNGKPVLNHHIGSDKSDNFADFKSFNESKIHTVSKPQVQKLPLTKDDHINNGNGVENTDSNLDGTVLPGGMKRDSDSGMFSTDISPIPVSEEGTIELNNCDKTVDSIDDDETDVVPELPTDTNVNDENIISVQQSPPELNSDVVHTDQSLCSKEENTGSTIPVSSVNVKSKASVDNLVDSDEEFDQYSSQALHSISKEAAHSSILYSHSVDKPENITQNNTLETDDNFVDFADFSDKTIKSSNWKSSDNKSNSVISNNEVEMELPSDSDTNSECITQSKPVEVIDTDKTRDNTADSVPPLKLKALEISSEDDDTSTTVNNVNINHSEEIDDQNSFVNDNIEKPEESKIVNNENSNDDEDDEFADFSKANETESLSVDNSNENDEIKDSENSAQEDDFTEFSSVQNDVSDNNSNIQTGDIVTSVVSNDDDDDFADFSSVSFSAKSVDNDQPQSNDCEKVVDNNNDDDDFADFSSATQPTVENNKTVSNDGDDDEFADFSSVTLPNKSQNNDDDFAEFSSANINSGSAVKSDSIKPMSVNYEEEDDDDFATQPTVENNKTVSNDDDDEFADFSSVTLPNKSQNDDDFAEFSRPNINSGSAVKLDSIKPMSDNYEEEDDDDFADFSGANVENQSLTKFEDKKDNFASFDQAKVVDEEDDWGKFDEDDDFDTGVTKQQVYKQPEAVKSQVNVVVQIDKLKTVLHACFNTNDDNIVKNQDISLLESLLVGSIYQQPTHINNGQNSEKKVLKQIYDYDNTNALIYQWKKSHSNDHLFKTLNIDTQNMFFGLKKQSVPLSVTSLTILEPIRGAIDSKKDKNIAALVEPNNTESIPPLQDMPPVEFDWDNSGLTNPLEAKTLDLDFMVLQENENSIKTGVFQSELLDAPRSSVKPMQPLEEILKNMKLTTTTAPTTVAKDENLSKEADTIINSLPLLSFMKSKVLMFRLQNS
ncbi:aftiphilin isoform X2 [Patella vulgata]|uniref:aftiphilin isoform X2 n=1 Tax=Patella vulgata TaxID=6465 RepID=UPI00217F39B0|nr:aftiphilin isoform X2 [Patella vulgata]